MNPTHECQSQKIDLYAIKFLWRLLFWPKFRIKLHFALDRSASKVLMNFLKETLWLILSVLYGPRCGSVDDNGRLIDGVYKPLAIHTSADRLFWLCHFCSKRLSNIIKPERITDL